MVIISVDIRALDAVTCVTKDNLEVESYQPWLPSTFDVSKDEKSQVITLMLHQHSIYIGPMTSIFGFNLHFYLTPIYLKGFVTASCTAEVLSHWHNLSTDREKYRYLLKFPTLFLKEWDVSRTTLYCDGINTNRFKKWKQLWLRCWCWW